MRAIQKIAFFLFLLVSSICQAADIGEISVSKPRYSASQISSEIKESDKDFYLKDDLSVGKLMCLEIKRDNTEVMEKFNIEISAINEILAKEKPTLVQNWTVEYYPQEGKVCGRRAPVKLRRF